MAPGGGLGPRRRAEVTFKPASRRRDVLPPRQRSQRLRWCREEAGVPPPIPCRDWQCPPLLAAVSDGIAGRRWVPGGGVRPSSAGQHPALGTRSSRGLRSGGGGLTGMLVAILGMNFFFFLISICGCSWAVFLDSSG